jgi:hypothetical protein
MAMWKATEHTAAFGCRSGGMHPASLRYFKFLSKNAPTLARYGCGTFAYALV